MPTLPTICNNTACGVVFASGFSVGGSSSASLTGCSSGPCPRCGGKGRVPDGEYSAIFNGINAVLLNTNDVKILNDIYKTLSDSIKKNDFTLTKRELTKTAPNWKNIWRLLPEDNVITAIAVYSFVLMLIQTAIMSYAALSDSKNINHHHYYYENGYENNKQDIPQENPKLQLKPLILAVKIALHRSY